MALAWRQRSLQQRIVLSVVLGLGVILSLFGLVSFLTIQQSVQAAYAERVTLAETLAQRVGDTLNGQLAFASREVDELEAEPGAAPADPLIASLVDLQQEIGTTTFLALTDTAGSTIWTDAPADSIRGESVRACAQQTIAAGAPRMQAIAAPAGTPGQPAVATGGEAAGGSSFACLAVPVRDAREALAGAVVARVDPRDSALDLVPASNLDGGTHAQLVDMAGDVVAGTPSPYANDADEHRALLAGLMQSHTAGYRIHGPPAPFSFRGHVVAYAPVPGLPAWGIVIEQQRDVAVAAPLRLAVRLGGFGFLALVLSAVVAWSDVSHVVRPLRQLTAAAERFAAGQLETPVRVEQANRADEVGILARSFETMRSRLNASLNEIAAWNRELEGRVAARTAEVEAHSRELAELYARLQARERERAELLQRSMAGQEEERRRLAQELHDETSQALASLQLGLERLASGSTAPHEARPLARQLQAVAAQTLEEVHRLAVELRPSVLDDVGLVAAVERYLRECAKRTGLAVDFATVGTDGFRLIAAAETVVYRITQGAITNVVQHAGAKHVSVLLERREGRLVVVVEDDGRGFDLEAVRAAPLEQRLGLAGMEERAALIGATLTIETAPGQGSTMFLEVPLELNCRKEDAHEQAENRARR